METHLIPREVREKYPSVHLLSDEEQRTFDQSIETYMGKARESLRIEKNGSNIFKVLQLNQKGITTATIPELFLAIENGIDLSELYADGREVILRSRDDFFPQNKYLAEALADKLRLVSFENPWIIKGLGITQGSSAYGLEFITTNAEIIEAPDFHHKNHGRTFSGVNDDYSITFDDKGKYQLFARDNGLSRLFMDSVSELIARDFHLAYSNDIGRVVVVNSAISEHFCEDNLKKY